MKVNKDCLFTLDKNKTEENNSTESKFFTILGDHDFIDDQNRPRTNNESQSTLAKEHITNNQIKYYIKIGTYNRIFNPMGMFSEGKNNKFIPKIGRNEFNFKQVNKSIFDMYINFLSTKNLAWLNNAEREMI